MSIEFPFTHYTKLRRRLTNILTQVFNSPAKASLWMLSKCFKVPNCWSNETGPEFQISAPKLTVICKMGFTFLPKVTTHWHWQSHESQSQKKTQIIVQWKTKGQKIWNYVFSGFHLSNDTIFTSFWGFSNLIFTTKRCETLIKDSSVPVRPKCQLCLA